MRDRWLLFCGWSVACASSPPSDPPLDEIGAESAEPQRFHLENSGTAEREGHTPRGFEGQGGGLFVGDDLNPGFPEGDGVQLYLSVDLGGPGDDDLADGSFEIHSAVLASAVTPEIAGTPFDDLGQLTAEEVVFEEFSSELWDLPAPDGGARCTFADQPAGAFSCDLPLAVQSALDEERRYVNFRLLFDAAGDGDGEQDLVSFYLDDVNTSQPGIFSLVVTATAR
jgi:hypothetical protein